MKVYAFGHRSRVGKDTACRFLVNELRATYPMSKICKIAFADSLKVIAHELYSFAGVQFPSVYDKDPELREKIIPDMHMTIIDVWVRLGNMLRELHPNVWVQKAINGKDTCDYLVISDLRYVNELQVLRERFGNNVKAIKIIRQDAPVRNTIADNAMEGFDDWNNIIMNNGSMSDLHSAVVNLL